MTSLFFYFLLLVRLYLAYQVMIGSKDNTYTHTVTALRSAKFMFIAGAFF